MFSFHIGNDDTTTNTDVITLNHFKSENESMYVTSLM